MLTAHLRISAPGGEGGAYLRVALIRRGRGVTYLIFPKSWPDHSRPQSPRQGSRPLALSNTGSPRFTDFSSNLANLIGWEYETNTLRMLRFDGKSVDRGLPVLEKARALDPCRRSEWSWALGTKMWPAMIIFLIHLLRINTNISCLLT